MYDLTIDNLVSALIEWTKGDMDSFTDDINELIEECFEDSGANNAKTTEDIKARRIIVVKGIMIKCLHELDHETTTRLEEQLLAYVKTSA